MSFFRTPSAGCLLVVLAAGLSTPVVARAQPPTGQGHSIAPRTLAASSGTQARPARTLPLSARADYSVRFQDGDEVVLLLRGNCALEQGKQRWSAPLMVLWELKGEGSPQRYLAYLEGNAEAPAQAQGPQGREQAPHLLVDLEASSPLVLEESREPADLPRSVNDPAYLRAYECRQAERTKLQQTQFTYESPLAGSPFAQAPRIRQHVTISPKFLGDALELKAETLEGSIPAEYVITVTGGVNIVVDNVPLEVSPGQTVLSRVDLTADRAVIWTDASRAGPAADFDIDSSTPFQVYLEGNIVVRQGSNDVRASHAFFDINQHRSLAMNAEVRTFLPDQQATLRLRAAEIRQQAETSFHAKNAFVTTSEFGRPGYRMQGSDIFMEERILPGAPVNPQTGQPANGSLWVTSLNNTIFVDDVPVFYAPYLSGPAENPNIPIRKFNVGYSGMFGATIETAWDMRAITGLNLDAGLDWQLQIDELTKRGPGIGTRAVFDVDHDLFGMPANHIGWGQFYYINDGGVDNLGLNRRDLSFPNANRGRVILRDHISLGPNTWLNAEVGHVFNQDRNFLEQYDEYEWDTQKDLENLLYLNHQVDNFTGSAIGTIKSDNFNDQTNWLPRGDLTLLAEPIFNTPVLWSTHSSVGYGQLKPAQAPPNTTVDPFTPLPYFTNVEGVVAMSRHELSMPFDVGPVHVDPYLLGELAYWDQDLNGDSLGRAYGSAGVRASVQFSKYMPQVKSDILGLNGLAHKVVYDMEYYYARASTGLNNVAQYNEFDENAQERFRERMVSVEFGGALPANLDPRFYAVRYGAGRAVTASYNELVDDMQTLWLGMRHRWQTKVGPPDAPRIIDWMELDLGTAIFPQANRDNFGQTFGLINGRYAWHVSPRTSFLANGIFDVFAGGQRVWNVGILNQRGSRGSVYVGLRQIEVDDNTINSQLLTSSFSYVLSPNLYVATAGIQYDVAEGLDRGESLTLTRIGEYFLLHFGFGYDRSRNNVGVAISLEPKFGSYGTSSMQLNNLLGIR